MKRFPWFPVTVERPDTPVPTSVAFEALYWDDADDAGGAGLAVVAWDDRSREFNVEQVLTLSPQEFRFLTDSGQLVVIRPSRPEDSDTGQFNARYPLPTEIMGAIMNGATPDNTSISAAIDSDGDVHTVVLETGLGLYARYSRTWHRLTDLTPIENLNIVTIDDADLNLYDDADSAGNMVNITDLHPAEQETIEVIQSREAPQSVTAAALRQDTVHVIVVASADDIPRAVAYAATDAGAGSRWYVARRARKLGYEAAFPWEEES